MTEIELRRQWNEQMERQAKACSWQARTWINWQASENLKIIAWLEAEQDQSRGVHENVIGDHADVIGL